VLCCTTHGACSICRDGTSRLLLGKLAGKADLSRKEAVMGPLVRAPAAALRRDYQAGTRSALARHSGEAAPPPAPAKCDPACVWGTCLKVRWPSGLKVGVPMISISWGSATTALADAWASFSLSVLSSLLGWSLLGSLPSILHKCRLASNC
jgi:hypothetical protein